MTTTATAMKMMMSRNRKVNTHFLQWQPTQQLQRSRCCPFVTSTRNKNCNIRLYSSLRNNNNYDDDDDKFLSNKNYNTNYDDQDSDDDDVYYNHDFQPGMKCLVEVVNFGPLGASVHVVAPGHSPNDLPPLDTNDDTAATTEWPVLAVGLINQRELAYHRDARNNVDVVLGEILPAYVERVRPDDGKLGLTLRPFGGRKKAMDLSEQIVQALEEEKDGTFHLGDKSSPDAIAAVFPGVSKSTFKKALSALFRQKIIERPGAYEIRLACKK